jgi:hypothetical protein
MTPGPWIAVKAEGKRERLGIFEVKTANDIASGFGHRSVVSEASALDKDDAQLIAAAPAMLKALTQLVKLIDALDADAWDARACCRAALEEAQDAIALAQPDLTRLTSR